MTSKAAAHLKEIAAAQHIPLDDHARMAPAANESMVLGINDAFYVATMLTVVAFALSFFIRKTEPPEDPA